MGINEVTKFLEAAAATAATPSTTSAGAKVKKRNDKTGKNEGVLDDLSGTASPTTAVVLVCSDVRPARLVEHLYALAALTSAW